MAIHLSDERRARAIESIRRYAGEYLDEDFGDLKASMLLEYFLQEIGPAVYNQAIADARARMYERIEDLDGVCHEPEFAYWKR